MTPQFSLLTLLTTHPCITIPIPHHVSHHQNFLKPIENIKITTKLNTKNLHIKTQHEKPTTFRTDNTQY